jgi:spore germination cell wall hydrolase CwlJ-like protein
MRIRVYLIALLLILSLVYILKPNFKEEKFINVYYSQLTQTAKKQVDCLAENIYFESGHEPEDGKIAVALVTLNRVQDPRYPNNICSVVKERVRSICQFSWYCESGKYVRNARAYEESKRVALHVYANYEKMKDITHGALFYHADYVSVRKIGVRGLEKTATIGRHIFYKEREGI